jgi:hypothetical protein
MKRAFILANFIASALLVQCGSAAFAQELAKRDLSDSKEPWVYPRMILFYTSVVYVS